MLYFNEAWSQARMRSRFKHIAACRVLPRAILSLRNITFSRHHPAPDSPLSSFVSPSSFSSRHTSKSLFPPMSNSLAPLPKRCTCAEGHSCLSRPLTADQASACCSRWTCVCERMSGGGWWGWRGYGQGRPRTYANMSQMCRCHSRFYPCLWLYAKRCTRRWRHKHSRCQVTQMQLGLTQA
jgi:hypothetical protein